MAEGARFELADPLRGLQFSRLARSATPSPLQTFIFQSLTRLSRFSLPSVVGYAASYRPSRHSTSSLAGPAKPLDGMIRFSIRVGKDKFTALGKLIACGKDRGVE